MKLRDIILYFSLFLLMGCTDELSETAPIDLGKGDNRIIFNAGFADNRTKVTTDADFKSSFEVGDAIGLFVVRRNKSNDNALLQASGNYYHNVKLTLNQSGSWVSDTDLFYAPDGEALDFYAYYPYNSAVTDPSNISFKVETDQNATTDGKSHYDKSELLASVPAKGIEKGQAVNLNFKHMLAMVYAEVPKLEMNGVKLKGVGPRETLELYLPEVATGGVFNLISQKITPGNEKANIRMCRVQKKGDAGYNDSYSYRALLPAQQIAANKAVSYQQDGKSYQHESTEVALAEGYAKRYTIGMPITSIHTNFIEAGTFIMGLPDDFEFTSGRSYQEKPQHYVQLTKNFRMSIYTITNAQYALFLNAWNDAYPHDRIRNGVHYNLTWAQDLTWFSITLSDTGIEYSKTRIEEVNGKWQAVPGYENYPMTFLSFYGAKAYTDWIGGNLATEAQWEYACRAGTTTLYSFGDDITNATDYSWSWLNIESTLKERNGAREVGLKKPNPWGLYDMHGNCREWVLDKSEYRTEADWHLSPNAYPSNTENTPRIDPLLTEGAHRIFRGGGWLLDAEEMLSGSKGYHSSESRSSHDAIRLVFNE